MRKILLKLWFLLMGLTIHMVAMNLEQKYPSYKYVFHEFNIDKSYIHNDAFIAFSKKNESFLHRFYKRSLLRGKEVLPTMKGLLLGEGVSDLFIYLSMVESGFSPTAISAKKAVGLWQFMPETAKHYNLTVGEDYDERYDTVRATSAAIHYLNKLHRQFNKWYLAAMAFNCGEGCVQKAIKKAGTDDLSILIDDRKKYLPKETRDYIKKILLIAMIGENNIFDQNTNDEGSEYIEVDVYAGDDLHDVAKQIKMKYSVLQKLNLAIKGGRVPSHKKKYRIRIPMDKVFAFYLRYELASKKDVWVSKKASIKPHLVSHYVLLGETIASIAKKYDTSSDEIMRVNKLENEYLTLDQFLVIPVSKTIFESTLLD